ncbi:hypothetical protein [Lentzea sp. NPDC060358]|uniref:hypothetical protein n=1 Tax=Lentzea sp. NPDC060358 TaxID=3347103 RepID=UPI0036607BEB
MRALWAAGGFAVLGSALLGVLVGMAFHGASPEDPQSRPPASTWVRSTTSTQPSTPATSTPASSTTPSAPATPDSPAPKPKTTTPPPAATNETPPPAAPPAATTTTTPPSDWSCSPLNPLPPPACRDRGTGE